MIQNFIKYFEFRNVENHMKAFTFSNRFKVKKDNSSKHNFNNCLNVSDTDALIDINHYKKKIQKKSIGVIATQFHMCLDKKRFL